MPSAVGLGGLGARLARYVFFDHTLFGPMNDVLTAFETCSLVLPVRVVGIICSACRRHERGM